MRIIELNDHLVKLYAKKILGFAYSKTHNALIAEDLSQEIMLSLANSLRNQRNIDDMNGFVYTVSCYTWSKYLRKNKKHWNNIDIEQVYDFSDNRSMEEYAIRNDLIEKMKQEIAYLAKLHRQITVMFYYEGKSGEAISERLGIPHSTVRWHLGKIRKKLREGIEIVNSNLNYTPQRLMAGHDGYTLPGYEQCGLGKDRLVDNICLACYGKTALSIEEIAKKLSVAAAYIENHIENLVYMDYLRVVGKNKYQTNFFISTIRHRILAGKFHYENIHQISMQIFNAFISKYQRIKKIGFVGSELDRDFILWAIIPCVTSDVYYNSLQVVLRNNGVTVDTPKRKDGSQHWVCATLVDDYYFGKQTEFTEDEIGFYGKSTGNGIKSRHDDESGLSSLQLDSFATMNIGMHWRDFDCPNLIEISRVAQIIRNNEKPNDMDKLIIAQLAKKGYVKSDNNSIYLLIPYFTKVEFDQLQIITEEIKDEVGRDIFVEYIENFAKMFSTQIPDHVPEADRIHFSHNIYPQYAVLYNLSDKELLRYPSDEEAKRLCTVIWNTR